MSSYVLDNGWTKARRRLAALERIEDPATILHLSAAGVSGGWHCLELGAGAGSITRWLCERVGRRGRVVATDVDLRLLQELDYEQLEIRHHDLVESDPEPASFDMVHARNLLIHLPQRAELIHKMAAAVKPNGWMIVEESDFATHCADVSTDHDLAQLFDSTCRKIYSYCESQGVDLQCGAKLHGWFRKLGFEQIVCEGIASVFQGASEDAECHKLTWEQFEAPVVAGGYVSAPEFKDFLSLLDDPTFSWRGPLRISVRGLRRSVA